MSATTPWVNPGPGSKAETAVQAGSGDLSLTLLAAGDALRDERLRREWQALLERLDSPNLLYVSPAWLEHMSRKAADGDCLLCVARDRQQQLVGAFPVRVQPYTLTYDVFNRTVLKSRMRTAAVWGTELLVPHSPEAYHHFFKSLLQALRPCDCVSLSVVPTQSDLFRFLQSAERSGRDFAVYLPFGVRPWHCLEFPDTFEKYLEALGKKARYNLRREVRKLREHGGSLELLRVTDEGQVEGWLDAAAQVSEKTWQHRVLGPRVQNTPEDREKLQDLARCRLLRAYVLKCGGQPAAFLIGYQFRGVYHYEETGFDPALADLSPGTVLLYLVLEDLFQHDPPSLLNFGIGDAAYKRRFGNREMADASVLLFRKTLRNRLRLAGHQAFQQAVRLAKWLLRRRVTK